jgi:phage gp29-like protein
MPRKQRQRVAKNAMTTPAPTIRKAPPSLKVLDGGQATSPPPERYAVAEMVLSDAFRLYGGRFNEVYNPSKLVGKDNYRSLTTMRRDDQIKAAMSLKKHAVLASGWNLEMPPDMEGHDEQSWGPCAFVQNQLDELDGSLHESLYQILIALDYGFSISERVYQEITTGDFAGMIGLKAIKSKRPDQFVFRVDEFGNITGIRQPGIGAVERAVNTDVPLWKIVLFIHQGEFGNPYGIPDLEAAYDPWFHKQNTIRWMMQMLERFGIPPIVAMYDPNQIQGAQQEQLRTIFKNWQSATSALIPRPDPEAIEIQFPELAGQVSRVFIPALDKFNQDISRALLMPGLLGITAETGSGSYARAKVQFDVFMLVVEKLRADLERVVNEQIVRPMIDLNYGDGPYPLFKLNPVAQDVRLDVMTTWAQLTGAGVVHSLPRDELHLRQQLEFPEVTEEELAAIADDARAVAEEKASREADARAGTKGPAGEAEPSARDVPNDMMVMAGRGVVRPTVATAEVHTHAERAPTRYERSINFALVRSELDEAQATALTTIMAALRGVRDKLLSGIARVIDEREIKAVRELVLPSMAGVERAIGAFLEGTLDAGRASGRRDLKNARTFSFDPSQPRADDGKWTDGGGGGGNGDERDPSSPGFKFEHADAVTGGRLKIKESFTGNATTSDEHVTLLGATVKRETDKAVLVSTEIDTAVGRRDLSVWLPKSQIVVAEDGSVTAPKWLVDKKDEEARANYPSGSYYGIQYQSGEGGEGKTVFHVKLKYDPDTVSAFKAAVGKRSWDGYDKTWTVDGSERDNLRAFVATLKG